MVTRVIFQMGLSLHNTQIRYYVKWHGYCPDGVLHNINPFNIILMFNRFYYVKWTKYYVKSSIDFIMLNDERD
jgi:hypothetical protein